MNPSEGDSKKVRQLIPENRDGFHKNINELAEEYRNGNIQCLAIVYRRKDLESTRTYFIGADDPHLFMALKRLEHDILGLYSEDCEIQEYDE